METCSDFQKPGTCTGESGGDGKLRLRLN